MNRKSKGIFVTGTGTDVGKTYVTALIVKKLNEAGLNPGYYKAALSGAESLAASDAGYVKKISGISQPYETMVSYIYKNAVSPHLASRIEGNPVDLVRVKDDFDHVKKKHNYVVVEGSGGIVCPIRYDGEQIFLEDVIKKLDLSVVIVGDAGLGTINSVTLTAEYLKQKSIPVKGIILNNFKGTDMEADNVRMIENINHIPVIGLVGNGEYNLDIEIDKLTEIFQEV
ncbi:MAG: dethiobiotin synthase [Eubacteriales bacterium]|jgi:dethiobiotin synthetase|nr:dethiobiotin synthase [Eubacteriales bacterium]